MATANTRSGRSALVAGAASAVLALVLPVTTGAAGAAAAAESVTVSGTVTDVSGQGWPVWAEVSVDGGPSTHTDPWTGRYTLQLPAGQEHTVRVRSEYPGYPEVTRTVEAGVTSVDVGLAVDAGGCVTDGYAHRSDGLVESFDSTSAPDGWTVVDNIGDGQAWHFDDPGERGNLTGARGSFAIADSGHYGYVTRQDAELVSPVVDLSGATAPEIGFNSDLYVFEYDQPGGIAEVDLSVDGGATWSNVWREVRQVRGPHQVVVPIPQAAGEPDVRVRFHYFEGIYTASEWWQVDNVYIGNRSCDPQPGSLVAGHVRDRNTGEPVNAATVRTDQLPDVVTRSMATPQDGGLDDGFYWTFVPRTGDTGFTARQRLFQPDAASVAVETGRTAQADFSLPAGQITASGAVVSDQQFGSQRTSRVTVRNTGTAPATVRLAERPGEFEILAARGEQGSEDPASAAGAASRVRGEFLPARSGGAGTETTPAAPAAVAAGSWSPLPDLPIQVNDNLAGAYGGRIYSVGGQSGPDFSIPAGYVYDPATSAWERIANMPRGRQAPVGAFVDGKLYVAGGWGPEWNAPIVPGMDVYDPATDTWTAGPDLPDPVAGAGSAVVDGQLYIVGGCFENSVCGTAMVSRYDPDAQRWERAADYPASTAWVTCGGIEGVLYCAGGTADRTSSQATYAYDPGADTWTRRADLPIDLWASSSAVAGGRLLMSGGVTDGTRTLTNQGFAYDPIADAWSPLPNATHVLYRGAAACGFHKVGGSNGGPSGTPFVEVLPGHTDCAEFRDSPWLSATGAGQLTLDPGASATVDLRLDAGELSQPGAYTASLLLRTDTPYRMGEVGVTMNVDAPRYWGKLAGTVTGTSCDGTSRPLARATVWVEGRTSRNTLTTDEQGRYAHWMEVYTGPARVTAGGGEWIPDAEQVRVRPGRLTVQDFALTPLYCG